MNKTLVFTSITASYIPKARALARSLKRYQPDWDLHLLYLDSIHRESVAADPLFKTVMTPEMLFGRDWRRWIFRLRIVEACTAAKSRAMKLMIQNHNPDKIVYLDPDIVLFGAMDEIATLLDRNPIVLTPHICQPEISYQAVLDNEQACLKYGIFNLGFLAIACSGQGLAFLDWWCQRCDRLCIDDLPNGLFTDQKWCNLAPIFFSELFILRDPSYNVATWNLAQRSLSFGEDGMLQVNGAPLRFYHFSGYDKGHGKVMAHKYSRKGDVVRELWEWYARDLEGLGQHEFGALNWGYGRFDDGSPILDEMRLTYRQRPDLQETFQNPFDTSPASGGFKAWWIESSQGHF